MTPKIILSALRKYPSGFPCGVDLLNNPFLNKGTAFSAEERERFALRGLLPPRINTEQEQVLRALENIRRYPTDLEKYIYMISLQDMNRTLFYRVLIDNLEELMPIIYTPTVGKACQEYGHIFTRPRGIFLTNHDQGRIADILRNWPFSDIRIIVVTDGERILGLGDLGADGMAIPIGKLSLYTACAGIDPATSLPITLDVGTDNEALLKDPMYIGMRQRRVRGPAYDALFDEFISAVSEVFPGALVQLEDFGNTNAFRLLQKYRSRKCLFDDDIQGTGTIALAGLYSALRLTGRRLEDQTILFCGAGEAGIGIADLIVAAMAENGLPPGQGRLRCWFFDSRGLVVGSRSDLADHKLAYAHPGECIPDFRSAVAALRPTAIIGVSGQPGIFSDDILQAMASINDRPLIFALSNPTSKAECTAESAYRQTGGTAIFASGSPFRPVTFQGRTFIPGQCNNAYVFPGVGLGALACGATSITDEMFLAAAKALAGLVTEQHLSQGLLFPPLSDIRTVSAHIAAAVADVACSQSLAAIACTGYTPDAMRAMMYDPSYQSYADFMPGQSGTAQTPNS